MGKKRKSAQSPSSQSAKRARQLSNQDDAKVTSKALPMAADDGQSSERAEHNPPTEQTPAISNESGTVPSPVNVPASPSSLIPPLADDPTLRKTHDIHVLAIAPSSKIEVKVRQALSLLKESLHQTATSKKDSKASAPKKILVALVARAPAANKCVSVVEIVKREMIKEKTSQVFQYTAVWAQLEPYSPKDGKKGLSSDMNEAQGLDNPRVRNTSCLAVYLACQSISKLKETYTEQVCVPKITS